MPIIFYIIIIIFLHAIMLCYYIYLIRLRFTIRNTQSTAVYRRSAHNENYKKKNHLSRQLKLVKNINIPVYYNNLYCYFW